jgi:hypothetical protein
LIAEITALSGVTGLPVSDFLVFETASEVGDWLHLLINAATMRDPNNENDKRIIFDSTHDPVITDTVTPQPGKISTQSLPELTRRLCNLLT